MREHKYILDSQKNPVPCSDLKEWARWIEESYKTRLRVVDMDELPGGVIVSTVFLGVDNNIDMGSADYKPHLFETLVLGGPHDGQMNRYSTWAEAEEGHRSMVADVFLPKIPYKYENS